MFVVSILPSNQFGSIWAHSYSDCKKKHHPVEKTLFAVVEMVFAERIF